MNCNSIASPIFKASEHSTIHTRNPSWEQWPYWTFCLIAALVMRAVVEVPVAAQWANSWNNLVCSSLEQKRGRNSRTAMSATVLASWFWSSFFITGRDVSTSYILKKRVFTHSLKRPLHAKTARPSGCHAMVSRLHSWLSPLTLTNNELTEDLIPFSFRLSSPTKHSSLSLLNKP